MHKQVLLYLSDLSSVDHPSLATLVSKATVLTQPRDLSTYFQGLGKSIPSGALSALAQGLIEVSNQEIWCQVTPYEYQVDQRTAYIVGNAALELSVEEQEAIYNALAPLLKIIHKSGTGFCSVSEHTDVVLTDFADIFNKDLKTVFPQGKDASYWQRLLTECQMALAQHPVNMARLGIWFWGLGALPANIKTDFGMIYSEDKVMQGLAKIANVPCSSQIDYDLLLKALKKGKIQKITLQISNQHAFELTKKHLYYFWRNNKIQ